MRHKEATQGSSHPPALAAKADAFTGQVAWTTGSDWNFCWAAAGRPEIRTPQPARIRAEEPTLPPQYQDSYFFLAAFLGCKLA
jgi:hypothetical protein